MPLNWLEETPAAPLVWVSFAAEDVLVAECLLVSLASDLDADALSEGKQMGLLKGHRLYSRCRRGRSAVEACNLSIIQQLSSSHVLGQVRGLDLRGCFAVRIDRVVARSAITWLVLHCEDPGFVYLRDVHTADHAVPVPLVGGSFGKRPEYLLAVVRSSAVVIYRVGAGNIDHKLLCSLVGIGVFTTVDCDTR